MKKFLTHVVVLLLVFSIGAAGMFLFVRKYFRLTPTDYSVKPTVHSELPAVHVEKDKLELEPATLAWPNDHVWQVSFPIPPKFYTGMKMGMEIRINSYPETSRIMMFAADQKIPTTQGSHTLNLGDIHAPKNIQLPANAKTQGVALIQLIDMTEIGAIPSAPNRSLQLVAKVGCGGGFATLAGKETLLQMGKLVFSVPPNPDSKWKNNELPMMFFETSDGKTRTRYNVVLVIK